MKTYPRVLAALPLLLVFLAGETLACRYTVRDSGFVDTGYSTWRLYLYTDGACDAKVRAAVTRDRPVLDANLRVKVVNDDEDHDYPRFEGITAYPAAVLVSPDRRSWVLPPIDPEASLSELFDGLVRSPARMRLREHLVNPFCAVLVIEGDDPVENERVKTTVEDAIERITPFLPGMDKPVDAPPVMVVLTGAERTTEEVLLFGLGIDDGETRRAHAAVVFGRGRRIGPLLSSDGITENRLLSIFQVVGMDCECDLNPIWLSGTLIPLVWGPLQRSEAAETLGFDPENPVVRMEVSRIVAYGQARIGWGDVDAGTLDPENPLGYREDTDFSNGDSGSGMDNAIALDTGSTTPTLTDIDPCSKIERTGHSSIRIVLGSTFVILIMVLLALAVIIIIRSHKNR